MKKLNPLFAVAAVTALLCSAAPAFADVISAWSFNNDDLSNPRNDTAPLAFDQTPAASTDNSVSQSAFATELGMTTNYNFGGGKNPPTTGSEAGADILNSTAEAGDFGSSDSGSNLWRIRGDAQNPGDPTGNGWALQAPQYTQGAEFYTDTTGFSNGIHVQFDYETTNQGIHDMQVQYTIDGSTWLNVTASQITIPNQARAIACVLPSKRGDHAG
jgi:hypothetical protein